MKLKPLYMSICLHKYIVVQHVLYVGHVRLTPAGVRIEYYGMKLSMMSIQTNHNLVNRSSFHRSLQPQNLSHNSIQDDFATTGLRTR